MVRHPGFPASGNAAGAVGPAAPRGPDVVAPEPARPRWISDALADGDFERLLAARGTARRELRAAADAVRRRTVGDTVCLRGLIEFSNRCVQNCLYCGLRRDNKELQRYSLDPNEVVAAATEAARAGYATVVLQGGEDPAWDRAAIENTVRCIKDAAPGLCVTLSVGERSRADYQAWRRAGADRYLLKHETADPGLYALLRPGRRLEARLERVRWLSGLGYQVGLGNMVGLPGQSVAALAADLRLLAGFRPYMVGTGPFLPHPRTPLGGCPPGDPDLALNFLAAVRLALPGAMIPATTATATAAAEGRSLALFAGANVVMLNVGPTWCRPLYEIYPSRLAADGSCTGSGAWDGALTVSI